MAYEKGNQGNVVIALGGNALGKTPEEQLELVKDTAKSILDMVEHGVNPIVTHGNGPQVGVIANAFGAASKDPDNKVPHMPFPECGAMSQGYIGYHLCQAIRAEMRKRNINRGVANIVTQVVVDENDPGFQDPTKPVGAFMTEEEAKAFAEETGATVKEDAGRGWRQVVASPIPVRIIESDVMQDLVDNGYIVIGTGGGGIPVIDRNPGYDGVPAVIDKDNSAALMAANFKADKLIILTAVDKVAINFGTPEQQDLDSMTIAEAEEYIAQGQFAPGSMLPKVEACMNYVKAHPEGEALITSLEQAAAALRGETGTIIKA